MLLLFYFCPLASVYLGEEGVGVGRAVVDPCEIDDRCPRECLLVDACPANDKHGVVCRCALRVAHRMAAWGVASLKGALQRWEHFASRNTLDRSAHNHVAPSRQCAMRQRVERVASHDNGVPHGKLFEVGHILWD